MEDREARSARSWNDLLGYGKSSRQNPFIAKVSDLVAVSQNRELATKS